MKEFTKEYQINSQVKLVVEFTGKYYFYNIYQDGDLVYKNRCGFTNINELIDNATEVFFVNEDMEA